MEITWNTQSNTHITCPDEAASYPCTQRFHKKDRQPRTEEEVSSKVKLNLMMKGKSGEKENMQRHYHKQKKRKKNTNDFSRTHEQVNMAGLVDIQWLRTQALKSDRPVSESQF